MDIDYIRELFIPRVIVGCLMLGYILKKWCPADNKWIPTILLVSGCLMGCIQHGVSFANIIAGGISGLASTGFHQLFKQIVEKG